MSFQLLDELLSKHRSFDFVLLVVVEQRSLVLYLHLGWVFLVILVIARVCVWWDYLTLLQLHQLQLSIGEESMWWLLEVLPHLKELHYIEVFCKVVDSLVQVQVSHVWIWFEGAEISTIMASQEVVECVPQVILEVSSIHYHLVDEVELLLSRLIADCFVAGISNRVPQVLLVLVGVVV